MLYTFLKLKISSTKKGIEEFLSICKSNISAESWFSWHAGDCLWMEDWLTTNKDNCKHLKVFKRVVNGVGGKVGNQQGSYSASDLDSLDNFEEFQNDYDEPSQGNRRNNGSSASKRTSSSSSTGGDLGGRGVSKAGRGSPDISYFNSSRNRSEIDEDHVPSSMKGYIPASRSLQNISDIDDGKS